MDSNLAETLLQTKFYIPSVRSELVTRPRLVNLLNECLNHKLTLISAPAGFGKTTLVSEWVNNFDSEESRPQLNGTTTWLSLDESDNDLGRFLSYFVTALQAFDKNIGQKAQAVFQSQQQLLIR